MRLPRFRIHSQSKPNVTPHPQSEFYARNQGNEDTSVTKLSKKKETCIHPAGVGEFALTHPDGLVALGPQVGHEVKVGTAKIAFVARLWLNVAHLRGNQRRFRLARQRIRTATGLTGPPTGESLVLLGFTDRHQRHELGVDARLLEDFALHGRRQRLALVNSHSVNEAKLAELKVQPKYGTWNKNKNYCNLSR